MEPNPDIATTPESAPSATVSAMGSEGMREFMRYFFASAVALIVDAGSLYVFTSILKIPYLYSGALSFFLGLMVVYLLSIAWVFEQRSIRSGAAEFALFALIGVIGLALNELVLYIGTGIFGFYYMFSKAASVIIVFSWNFAARKRMLFAHE